MILRRDHLAAIVSHALETFPDECCGLIGGEHSRAQTIYRLTNVTANPRLAYEAAPEELFAAQRQMRQLGETLLAIYHSHPRSVDPGPSETDVRLAFYPSATYLIIGLGGEQPVVKAFEISEQAQSWHQVEYAIAD
jgi:proteasome lid subunit RPN8/RPN11